MNQKIVILSPNTKTAVRIDGCREVGDRGLEFKS